MKIRTKHPKMKMLNERVWNSDQSWNLERVLSFGEHRLRLRIRHNAYDFQSYGRIERWNGDQWFVVHVIPGVSLKGKMSYTQRDITVKHFSQADIDELMTVAASVLS